jgi:hypothetical protein
MKKILRIIALALSLALVASNSYAAVKAGSACSKAGMKNVIAGKTYTCVKSGKKLVWDKGVLIPVEKPLTPAASPTSFEDLSSHLDGIIYGAWLKASQQIQGASSPLGNLKILVGPNTTEINTKSGDSLSLLAKLFANSLQVKNLTVIKYSKADIEWAQQQYESLGPNNKRAGAAASYCLDSSGCRGGIAGINANGDGVILLGQGGDYGYPDVNGGAIAMDGFVLSHEYTHTVQAINATCRNGKGCYGNLPQWLMEGGAEWSGSVSRFSDKYSDYLTFRTRNLSNKYSDATKFPPDWINTFLNPNPVFLPDQDNWAYWTKYPSGNVYTIGLMATEILVSIKGPGAVMKLYEGVGGGQTFVDVFKQEFGIAWSDACPLIANAISSELARGIKR